MSKTFTPPTVAEVPPIAPNDPVEGRKRLANRLFRFYPVGLRGVNVFLMSDGTVTTSHTNAPSYQTDVVVNNEMNESWYGTTVTHVPLPNPHVVSVFYGGHSYTVTDAQAAQLTAAGFGANLS